MIVQFSAKFILSLQNFSWILVYAFLPAFNGLGRPSNGLTFGDAAPRPFAAPASALQRRIQLRQPRQKQQFVLSLLELSDSDCAAAETIATRQPHSLRKPTRLLLLLLFYRVRQCICDSHLIACKSCAISWLVRQLTFWSFFGAHSYFLSFLFSL